MSVPLNKDNVRPKGAKPIAHWRDVTLQKKEVLNHTTVKTSTQA